MKVKDVLIYGLLILLCLYSFQIINEDFTVNPDKYTEPIIHSILIKICFVLAAISFGIAIIYTITINGCGGMGL